MLLLAGFKQYPPTDLVDPDPAVGAVVHGVVVDVDVVAGPGHLQYSTVQYGTLQYSTVQYSPHHPAPHELLGLDESVGLGLREGEVGAWTCDLQARDLHPGHLRQSGRSRAVNKPLFFSGLEKASTRPYPCLKSPTGAFTRKNLLRHYARSMGV